MILKTIQRFWQEISFKINILKISILIPKLEKQLQYCLKKPALLHMQQG
jgi:hypothetical protein